MNAQQQTGAILPEPVNRQQRQQQRLGAGQNRMQNSEQSWLELPLE
ncbi:MAG: hypothetical protein OIF57_08330 [Marinobacterium sp.]|nr:hypothetical protein [Marinobacterium sp.]